MRKANSSSWDLLATSGGRKALFTCLYLSEGAPIGFIWLALPTRMRVDGVPIERIAWFTGALVLPWAAKFLWAPLVDLFRTDRWTLRHWIISAQCLMGLTLAPLMWLDLKADFSLVAGLLFLHALSAATQDVAIDALCISVTKPSERGQFNGWMQAGMLLGRASMGGGALVLAEYLSESAVVGVLIGITTFSMLLVLLARLPADDRAAGASFGRRGEQVRSAALAAISHRNTWLGLAFALLGGAAFKSLEVVYGPFLVDRGFEQKAIGAFAAGPMILSMVFGAVLGGWLADRWGRRRFVAASLLFIAGSIAAVALCDAQDAGPRNPRLMPLLTATALGIGMFTSSSYALFMDITAPAIAATQFSAFMGATNGCESWSVAAIGVIIEAYGYPRAMLVMCGASLLALPILWRLQAEAPARALAPQEEAAT